MFISDLLPDAEWARDCLKKSQFIVYVPFWISEAMARRNVPLAKVTDYVTMREIFSAETLAGLNALQVSWGEGSLINSTLLFTEWQESATQAHTTELVSVVTPLSGNNKVLESVIHRLEEGDLYEDEVPFTIIDGGRDCMLLVLKPASRRYIKTPIGLETTLRALVKQSYVYYGEEQVAGLAVFKSYVRLLSSSMRNISP